MTKPMTDERWREFGNLLRSVGCYSWFTEIREETNQLHEENTRARELLEAAKEEVSRIRLHNKIRAFLDKGV